MTNRRPFDLLAYLPAVYAREDRERGDLARFLAAFRDLFEELQGAIEGDGAGERRVRVQAVDGTRLTVDPIPLGPVPLPAGSAVRLIGKNARGRLAKELPAGSDRDPPRITELVLDAPLDGLEVDDEVLLFGGGLPDLAHPDATPPPQLPHADPEELNHLAWLAGWVDVPIRPDKDAAWNRRWLHTALRWQDRRSTTTGFTTMLRAWLDGDLATDLEGAARALLVTDFAPEREDDLSAARLGREDTRSVLGLGIVLGRGPPHLFRVDLVLAPGPPALASPAGQDVQSAIRSFVAREKPAGVVCELTVRKVEADQDIVIREVIP